MSRNDKVGIRKIAVKGFKSIVKECEIEIRPLTILAGVNSSGKSSIMQPLLMLKQTLEAPYDPGPLLIDGPNVQFTETTQFFSTLQGEDRTDDLRIYIETDVFNFFESVKTLFRKEKDKIEIVEMTAERKSMESSSSMSFPLFPDMTAKEIKALSDQPLISPYSSDKLPEEVRKLTEHTKQFVQDFLPKDTETVSRSRCFFRLWSHIGTEIHYITSNLNRSIQNSIHIPGLRGNPERSYKMAGTGPRYPGTFENYVASIIHKWQIEKNENLEELTASLRSLNLTGQVGTSKTGDAHVEVQVGRLPQNNAVETDMVNIADVGFGVSQVLPVIVALIAANPGQLVYLEQPELHLHPNAQVALAQVLADAAKRGVRVVAETHSSLLLLGVQILVAEGQLAPELVKLHWFSRNKEGITEVDSVDLDEAGRYGDWSVDFDKVDIRSEDRYLTALDKLRFGKE